MHYWSCIKKVETKCSNSFGLSMCTQCPAPFTCPTFAKGKSRLISGVSADLHGVGGTKERGVNTAVYGGHFTSSVQ